jgi:hypothetical protein
MLTMIKIEVWITELNLQVLSLNLDINYLFLPKETHPETPRPLLDKSMDPNTLGKAEGPGFEIQRRRPRNICKC